MAKKVLFNFSFIVLFTLILFSQACDDTITGDDIDSRVIPDKDVSYNEHLQPVFSLKCGSSGCHNSESRAGEFSLTICGDTDFTVISPGNPDVSKLVWVIENSPNIAHDYFIPFNENQREGVRTWIEEGAKCN